jgi:hypothetical protein
LKIFRDIIIVVFIIALAVMIRVWISSKQQPTREINLGEDIIPTEGMGAAGNAALLPEDDENIALTLLEQEITRGEINHKANKMWAMASGGMGGIPEVAEMRNELLFQTMAEMLSEMLLYHIADELGLDVDTIASEALKVWAEGYESPEEKLKEIEGMKGVTAEDMRKLLKNEAVYRMVEKTITKDMQDVSDEDKSVFFKTWFASELIGLEIEFGDETLGSMWTEYIDTLNAHDEEKNLEESSVNDDT